MAAIWLLRVADAELVEVTEQVGRILVDAERAGALQLLAPVAAGEQADALGLAIEDCVVVGDSVWDLLAARRARALGVGLLAGGYGREELERAGAFRVYEDPADLLRHLDELGIRDAE